MNIHHFTHDTGSKTCTVCGKTRGAKAHKDAKALDAQVDAATEVEMAKEAEVDTGMTEDELDAAVAESEIAAEDESWGIPPVPDFVPNTPEQQAEVDARQAQADDEPAQADEEAPAPKKGVEPNTIRLWVGWRITNAAVLRDSTKAEKSLAAKLKAAKPTSELDRYVYLTVDELRKLDAVAVKFAEPGNTGPVVYSARTLRRRIAEAIATLEGTK